MNSTSVVPRKKTFDCIRMKRSLQERIGREIARMTDEERLEWFRREADALWRSLHPAEGSVAPAGCGSPPAET